MKILSIMTMLLVLIPVIALAQTDISYTLKLKYDGVTLINEGLSLIEGKTPERLNQPETGFTLIVVSPEGEVLHSFKFIIPTTPVAAPPQDIFTEDGTQIAYPEDDLREPTDTTVALTIPYFENAKSIDIYNENNQLLLSVDVSKYSKETGTGFDPMLIIGLIITLMVIVLIVLFYTKKSTKKKKKEKKHHKK